MELPSITRYLKYIQSKIKNIFRLSLLFSLLGFLYILFANPKYDVDIIVSKLDQDNLAQSGSGSSLISLALSQAGDGPKFYHDFQDNFYSLEVTEIYDQKFNGMQKHFGSLYNPDKNEYRSVWGIDPFLKSLKYFILGVDYSSAPDIRALNDQIKAMISVNYDKYADNIIISSTTENPDFTKIMISELLIATDENFKNQERSSLDNMIIYLNGELSVAQAISQRDAISQILKSQLLKQALVNSDSLYKVKVVREVETSRYPTSPNIFFTLILFSIVGFFISLARHTIIFIRSHTNILSFLSREI